MCMSFIPQHLVLSLPEGMYFLLYESFLPLSQCCFFLTVLVTYLFKLLLSDQHSEVQRW